MTSPLRVDTDNRGLTTLTLDRPRRRNALDEGLVRAATRALEEAVRDAATRVVVLTGAGDAFCGGMDLYETRDLQDAEPSVNTANASALAMLFETLYRLPKPTIARVNGPAFGGGLGLIACCDIAVAVRGSRFAFSEVRLGLIPAIIAPYLLRALGPRQARRWLLSGEPFETKEAMRMGLVHAVAGAEDLDMAVERQVRHLLAGGPEALTVCKRLLEDLVPTDEGLAGALAACRIGAEAREGVAAFLEKRTPVWPGPGGKRPGGRS